MNKLNARQGLAAGVAAAVIASGTWIASVLIRSADEYVYVTRYRISRLYVEDGFFSKPLIRWDGKKVLLSKLSNFPGGNRIAALGSDNWSQVFNDKETVKKVFNRVDKTRDPWKVKTKQGSIFKVKRFRQSIRVINTAGTKAIDRTHSVLWTYWPKLKSVGIYNCRRIAGSSTWSQHAFANAEDVAFSTEVLDQVARYLKSREGSRWVSEVLWRVPAHYSHIHYSGEPKMYGTPACAR